MSDANSTPSASPAPAPAQAPASAQATPAPSSGASTPGPSAEPSRGGPGVSSDVIKTLEWDPFGPEGLQTEDKPPAPATPDPAQAPVSSTPSPAPAAPAPSATPVTIESLTREIAELKTKLATTPQPAAPAPAPQQSEPEDDTPPYAFNLPPSIMAKMRSEDPEEARQGVNLLLQGAFRAAHKLIVNQLRGETMSVLQNYVHQQFTLRAAAQHIVQDYYGKFQAHNKAELRPIVKQITDAYMAEMGNPAWSDAVRDQIGARVDAFLASFRPPAPAAPGPTPPVMTLPGNRPAAPPATSALQAELDDFMKL